MAPRIVSLLIVLVFGLAALGAQESGEGPAMPATASESPAAPLMVEPQPLEAAVFTAPLFADSPELWLGVSAVGISGGLALAVWRVFDFAQNAPAGLGQPIVQADLILGGLGLVISAASAVSFHHFGTQLGLY